MGKMAMVIVLGLTLSAFFLGYTMNRSNVESVTNISGYFKYSAARNIAHTAVTISLHQLETGDDSTTTFSGPVMGGTYWVNVNFKLNPDGTKTDTLDITSRGRYVDTTYTMRLRLRRYPKHFPIAKAPVNICLDSVDYSMSGNTLVNAQNHDINGNVLPDTTARPAVAALTGTDSATVSAASSHLKGLPQIMVDPGLASPVDYVEEYIADADRKYTQGTYASNMTWGSAASPWIIYCDAGGGTVKFAGNIEGWGILVVNGNLTLGGTFNFHGLVVVYPGGTVDDSFSMAAGTPRIIGAVFVAGGNGSSFSMKGNGKVLYSLEALDAASHIKKLLAYRILSWYE